MGIAVRNLIYIIGFFIISSSAIAQEGQLKHTLKYGQYTLRNPSQSSEIATTSYGCEKFFFKTYDCEPAQTETVELEVNEHSEQATSWEVEFFKSNNYSQSFELTSFYHTYTSSNAPGEEGIIKTGLLTWNFKYTLNTDGIFQPYAGIGLGISYNHFRGQIRGSTMGSIVTPRLGFHIGSRNLSFTAEIIYVRDTGQDDTFESNTQVGEIAGDYDLNGYLTTVGLRLGF